MARFLFLLWIFGCLVAPAAWGAEGSSARSKAMGIAIPGQPINLVPDSSQATLMRLVNRSLQRTCNQLEIFLWTFSPGNEAASDNVFHEILGRLKDAGFDLEKADSKNLTEDETLVLGDSGTAQMTSIWKTSETDLMVIWCQGDKKKPADTEKPTTPAATPDTPKEDTVKTATSDTPASEPAPEPTADTEKKPEKKPKKKEPDLPLEARELPPVVVTLPPVSAENVAPGKKDEPPMPPAIPVKPVAQALLPPLDERKDLPDMGEFLVTPSAPAPTSAPPSATEPAAPIIPPAPLVLGDATKLPKKGMLSPEEARKYMAKLMGIEEPAAPVPAPAPTAPPVIAQEPAPTPAPAPVAVAAPVVAKAAPPPSSVFVKMYLDPPLPTPATPIPVKEAPRIPTVPDYVPSPAMTAYQRPYETAPLIPGTAGIDNLLLAQKVKTDPPSMPQALPQQLLPAEPLNLPQKPYSLEAFQTLPTLAPVKVAEAPVVQKPAEPVVVVEKPMEITAPLPKTPPAPEQAPGKIKITTLPNAQVPVEALPIPVAVSMVKTIAEPVPAPVPVPIVLQEKKPSIKIQILPPSDVAASVPDSAPVKSIVAMAEPLPINPSVIAAEPPALPPTQVNMLSAYTDMPPAGPIAPGYADASPVVLPPAEPQFIMTEQPMIDAPLPAVPIASAAPTVAFVEAEKTAPSILPPVVVPTPELDPIAAPEPAAVPTPVKVALPIVPVSLPAVPAPVPVIPVQPTRTRVSDWLTTCPKSTWLNAQKDGQWKMAWIKGGPDSLGRCRVAYKGYSAAGDAWVDKAQMRPLPVGVK